MVHEAKRLGTTALGDGLKQVNYITKFSFPIPYFFSPSQGYEVKMEPRTVVCHRLKLIKFDPPYFTLAIVSGPGFYVRSLVHDLGLGKSLNGNQVVFQVMKCDLFKSEC